MMRSQVPLQKGKSAIVSTSASLPANVLQRKCNCGGLSGLDGQCERRRKRRLDHGTLPMQAKLSISSPTDKFEREADRVADHVLGVTDPVSHTTPTIQRLSPLPEGKGAAEQGAAEQGAAEQGVSEQGVAEQGDDCLQADAESGRAAEVGPQVASRIEAVRSVGGQPLPPAERAFFERRFGHDFSGVRVHTGARAAESARAVLAHAFTIGRDIVFGANRFAPGTVGGRRTLAHELTHVVQQSSLPAARSGRVTVTGLAMRQAGTILQRVVDCSRYRTRSACMPLGFPTRDCLDVNGRMSKCFFPGLAQGCTCRTVSIEPPPTGRVLDLLLLLLLIILLRGVPVPQPVPGGAPGVLPITPERPFGPRGPQTARRGGAGSAAAQALLAALRSGGTESVQVPGGRTVPLPLGVRAALEMEPETHQSVLRSLAAPPPMEQLESAVAQQISQADPSLLALLESETGRLPAAVRGALPTRSAAGQAMA